MTAFARPEDAAAAPLVAGALAVAGALGVVAGIAGPAMAFIVLGALVPLPLILRDYRTGVAMLAAMLPIASMLPSVKGLNPLNFVTAATLVSLFLRDAFSSRRAVRLPGVLWAGLVLPATWAIVVAWPHIPEGVHNYPLLDNAREIYDPWSYVAARYAKPLFYYLSFAMLVANAARDSRRPERFALLLAAAMVLPSLAVFVTVHQYPGTLADVSRDREFMAPRGMHANEFGMLLAAGSGPLLFGAAGAGRRTARWTLRAAFALVTLALVLTFSRGGLTAWLVVVGGYLVQHRRLKTFLVAATVGALALAAAPQSVTERFGAGMHEGAISDVSDVGKDELTAGRVHGWQLLARVGMHNDCFLAGPTDTGPAGAFPACRSALDVFDLEGNAAEHMNLPLDPTQMAGAGSRTLGVTEMKGSWFVFDTYHAHEDWCRWRAPFWHGSRVMDPRSHANYHLGFRCCKSL